VYTPVVCPLAFVVLGCQNIPDDMGPARHSSEARRVPRAQKHSAALHRGCRGLGRGRRAGWAVVASRQQETALWCGVVAQPPVWWNQAAKPRLERAWAFPWDRVAVASSSSPGAAPPAASEDHARNPPQPRTPGVTPPASKRSPSGRVLGAQTHPGPSLPLRGRRGSKVRSGKRDTGTHHTWTPPQRNHDTTPANTFHPTTPAHSRPTPPHAHTHHRISSSARAHARNAPQPRPRAHTHARGTCRRQNACFLVSSHPPPAHGRPRTCSVFFLPGRVFCTPVAWGCSRFVGGTLASRVLSRFSLVVCARTLHGYPVV
jgi:hypothetical protein